MSRIKPFVVPMSLTAEQVNAAPVVLRGKLPRCEWTRVSPELAMQWLEGANQNNRTIRENHVKKLAVDMEEGRWRGTNGEAIRFDVNGRLVDGQHRLWACIYSGKAFDTLVVYDVAADDYSTIGVGAKKSFSDFLGPMHNEKNVYLLASTIRMVYLWRNGDLAEARDGGGHLAPSMTELEQTFRENPKVRESVNFVSGHTAARRLLNATYCSLIHYAGTLEGEAASVESFIERLGTGLGLAEDDPIYRLRLKLDAERNATRGYKRVARGYFLALAIKAWNASKRGEKMRQLVFRPNEPFPVL